jgi:hypothetical protein
MRTEIVRLARQSLVYGTRQVLIRFISLILLPVFPSSLTPAVRRDVDPRGCPHMS